MDIVENLEYILKNYPFEQLDDSTAERQYTLLVSTFELERGHVKDMLNDSRCISLSLLDRLSDEQSITVFRGKRAIMFYDSVVCDPSWYVHEGIHYLHARGRISHDIPYAYAFGYLDKVVRGDIDDLLCDALSHVQSYGIERSDRMPRNDEDFEAACCGAKLAAYAYQNNNNVHDMFLALRNMIFDR